ncbi:hypothetical protein FJZ48_01155 [Candidatus Uhrbacteria bacterium]|nr:hypothetical protein [Candidatus Uhrbacteria bacterium]
MLVARLHRDDHRSAGTDHVRDHGGGHVVWHDHVELEHPVQILYPIPMLLLCIGPDTFRAQEKARELENAFKQKYDPSGSSVERIMPGKDAVDEIAQRANTVSLFSPRRFLRTSNLLTDGAKSKQAVLVQALSKDPENIIVVSVESEPPSTAIEKALAQVPKIIKYEFPAQQGAGFFRWASEIAGRLGIQDQTAIHRIAEATDGDSWFAWNELLKLAAGGAHTAEKTEFSPSIYTYTEQYLQNQDGWKDALQDADLASQLLNTLLSQARAALRVRDGAIDGLHPYVVKKWRNNKIISHERYLAIALRALFMQRAGFSDDQEATTIL